MGPTSLRFLPSPIALKIEVSHEPAYQLAKNLSQMSLSKKMSYEICKYCGYEYTDYNTHLTSCWDFLGIMPQQVGLSNRASHYNCFLNCALKAILLLDTNRAIRHSPFSNTSNLGIILMRFLSNYDQALSRSNKLVNVEDIRNVLAQQYEQSGEFQLFETADCASALEVLLTAAHYPRIIGEVCCCDVHSIFGVNFSYRMICSCNRQQQPKKIESFYLMVHVDLLLEGNDLIPSMFQDKLKERIEIDSIVKTCDCSDLQIIHDRLYAPPEVLVVKLIWSNHSASREQVACVMVALPRKYRPTIFKESNDQSDYKLVGLVLYMPGHYFAVFKSEGKWIVHEDESVLPVSANPHFYSVIDEVLRREAMPTLAFYRREEMTRMQRLEQIIQMKDWAKLGTGPAKYREQSTGYGHPSYR